MSGVRPAAALRFSSVAGRHIRARPQPCLGSGYHTFGFKIATGAMRPRNDMKMVGFARKPTIFISEMFEIRLAGAPYLGSGCHAFKFKIATAALRPRNDTNS